jgi:hypothetical protein
VTPREEVAAIVRRLGQRAAALLQQLAEDLASDASGARSDLYAVVHGLDDQQIGQLLRVARALALPFAETIGPNSTVVTGPFAAEFRSRLQAHHATHNTPMDRLSFEAAFLAASDAAGRPTDEAPSRTTRFFDATVGGEQTSLKTEAAKAMKAGQLHVSKLSEAAWIQDMRAGRKRRERTLAFLDEFLAAVDRIFVLRFYRSDRVPHYELVEIPTAHFELVRSAPAAQFNRDAPRIPIFDEEGPIMEFCLDRSDSKITVRKIEKSRCIVHGDWRLVGLGDSPGMSM